MGPVEACDAPISEREVHIDSVIYALNAAVVDLVVRVMDMPAMQYRLILMMIMIALQVGMQGTERRKHETHAEKQ